MLSKLIVVDDFGPSSAADPRKTLWHASASGVTLSVSAPPQIHRTRDVEFGVNRRNLAPLGITSARGGWWGVKSLFGDRFAAWIAGSGYRESGVSRSRFDVRRGCCSCCFVSGALSELERINSPGQMIMLNEVEESKLEFGVASESSLLSFSPEGGGATECETVVRTEFEFDAPGNDMRADFEYFGLCDVDPAQCRETGLRLLPGDSRLDREGRLALPWQFLCLGAVGTFRVEGDSLSIIKSS